MSSVDEAKYEELVVSLSNSFSIFDGGGSSLGEGILISSGVSQLNELDDYYNDMGSASEAEETDEQHMVNIEKVEDEHFITINHEMTKLHFISFIA